MPGAAARPAWQDRIRLLRYRDALEWAPLPPMPMDPADRRPSPPRGVSTMAYAPEVQFEVWRSHLGSPISAALPPGVEPADGFVAEFMVCHLGSVALASGHLSSHSFGRAPGGSPRQGPGDGWRLTLVRRGEVEIEHPDRRMTARAGDLFLLSMGAAFRGRIADFEGVVLTLPRDAFVPVAASLDAASGAVLSGGLAAVLKDYLLILETRLFGLGPQDLLQLGRATADVVSACIQPSPERLEQARGGIGPVLFERARSYIQAHLGDVELTPERVAQELRVSRSNLYRVFERAGGISRYILRCRLFAAHAALSADAGRRIQDVAYSCGFKLASDFTRAFRREFGYSPREAREARWKPAAQPAADMAAE